MIAEGLASLFGQGASLSLDSLNPRDPAIVKMLGLGNQSLSGVRVDEETVLGYPAVWRGVNIISNGVAKVRPLIYERVPDGKRRAIEHPSWRAITRQSNASLSAAQCRKTLTAIAMLWGNGIGLINRLGNGGIGTITPLPPASTGMTVIRGKRQYSEDTTPQEGDTLKYWTMVDGQVKTLEPDDVIHIKGLSMTGYWGIRVVEVLRDSFGLGMAARESGNRLFGQGSVGSFVIFMPPGLVEEQQDEFREQVKKGTAGLGKAHRAMIFEEGAKVEKLTIPPNDAQFLETREFEIREVANALGIQSHKLGDPNRTSYNSLEQANQEHLDDDLDPWLQVWEDELEAKGLTTAEQDNDSHYIEFNRKQLMRTNQEAQTNRERFEREWGISTANDIRKRNNESQVGEVGDTYLVPANMHVLDNQGMPVLAAEETPPATDRTALAALTMDRAERFARKIANTAKAKAKDGKAFCEFLDGIGSMEKTPDCVANYLEAVAVGMHGELSAYIEPPYAASELESNVLAAIPQIQANALAIVQTQLENEP